MGGCRRATCRKCNRHMSISIDPNYDKDSGGNACAYFKGKRVRATFFQRPFGKLRFIEIKHRVIIIEKPMIVPNYSDGKEATMLELGWQGIKLAALYAGASGLQGEDIVERTVNEWKGGRHKPQVHMDAWDELNDAEREACGGERTGTLIYEALTRGAKAHWRDGRSKNNWYPAKSGIPDLLDAVSIGLVEFGRLEDPR